VVANFYESQGLSPFEVLKQQAPESFEHKLMELTLKNAKTLGIDHKLGSIEQNKKPGLSVISGFDFKLNCLTEQASIKRII
jgi:N-acetylglucosamine-6-phosphate deacetylase